MRISDFFFCLFFSISGVTVNMDPSTTDPDPGPCKLHNANKTWRKKTVGDCQFTGSCDVRPVGNLLQKLQRISWLWSLLVLPVPISLYYPQSCWENNQLDVFSTKLNRLFDCITRYFGIHNWRLVRPWIWLFRSDSHCRWMVWKGVKSIASNVPLRLWGDSFALFQQLSNEERKDIGCIRDVLQIAFATDPFVYRFVAGRLNSNDSVNV